MKITKQDLQGAVDTLNRISCNCNYCATFTRTGKPCAFESNGAYGGWQLCQQTAGGGVRNVLSMGHRPKRELYNLIWAFIKGIQSA